MKYLPLAFLAGVFSLLLLSCGSKSPLEKEATAIINSKCRKCHTTKRIYDKKQNAQWWEKTLRRMQNYGTELTEEETRLLIEYLSQGR
ncbi:MAG: hypothetical protein GXO20_04805 [Thermodesulfobacteria bacterium]|nr:hypothetical protein [Thermodesulfobacteriota bacterium]